MRSTTTRRLLVAAFSIFIIGALLSLLRQRPPPARSSINARAPIEVAPDPIDVRPLSDAGDRPDSTPPAVPLGLSGRVTLKGRPVRGCLVACDAASSPLDHPETRTDVGGRFSLAVPLSSRYRVRAASLAGYAETTVTESFARSNPVDLELVALRYEYLRIIDDRGAPVILGSVGSLGDINHVGYRWTSVREWGESCENIGAMLDIDFGTSQNELLLIGEYHLLRIGDVEYGRSGQGRTLAVPGYEPTTVAVSPRPLSDWPLATDVRLRRDETQPTLMTYRLVLPEPLPPKGWAEDGAWRELPFAIVVQGDRPYTFWPTRARPRFRAASGCKFTVRMEMWTISFMLAEGTDEIEVRPTLPETGWLEMFFPSSHPEDATALAQPWLYPVMDDAGTIESGFLGVVVRPGYARFGPIPVGKYVVVLAWDGARERPQWRMPTPVTVDAGANACHVDDCR